MDVQVCNITVMSHDQYRQIAYPKFLVAQTCLKKGSRNIFFCLLKTVIAILRSIYYYCINNNHFLCQILLCTNAVLKSFTFLQYCIINIFSLLLLFLLALFKVIALQTIAMA